MAQRQQFAESAAVHCTVRARASRVAGAAAAALCLASGATVAWAQGPTELISRNSAHTNSANDGSQDVKWDDAGRFAAFYSDATDLVAGQTGPAFGQAFLYDRVTGSVTLVSHAAASPLQASNDFVNSVEISADGNFVLFDSGATDLVAGQVDSNSGSDLFLWQRATNTSQLVSRSVASATTTANSPTQVGLMSADGQFVTFTSAATDLPGVTTKNNACTDVFLFDRTNSQVVLVSRIGSSPTTTTNSCSKSPTISGDGRFVAYETSGTDLLVVVTDANGTGTDVYLFDRAPSGGPAVRLVSRHTALSTGNGPSSKPVICRDGSCVAFTSAASDIQGVTLDSNGSQDAFLYDRLSDTLLLVSRKNTSATTTASDQANNPKPSNDGSYVAFQSFATNHLAGQVDTNNRDDVFEWDRTGAQSVVRMVTHLPGLPATAAEGNASGGTFFVLAISLDGASVLYTSTAVDLVANQVDANGEPDVFVWDRLSSRNRLVSHIPGSLVTTGNAGAEVVALARKKLIAGFESAATNLVPVDGNARNDVFLQVLLLFGDDFESGDLSAWVASP